MVRVLGWLIFLGLFMPVLAGTAAPDPHSFANFQQVRTRHLVLDLAVDFTRQQLTGYAEHQLERLDPSINRLVLDSRHLKITTVTFTNDGVHWQKAAYLLGIEDALKGQPLTIQLQNNTKAVRVYYQTTPQASGLQWLTAAQTSEKKQPFLFSQSQAIHARSWIPLQDTPANRITYQARIKTPADLLAVMSADNSANFNRNGDYQFDMPQPLPSYLIALAVGDLHFKAMSADTGVYAEKLWLDRATAEFSDTQKMMDAANQLFGKYPWKRYDLLVLPSSFPFGGMENPRLSFVTPTIITGDKSLISLVAHELAHSWSGNLVTNATWRDLWLNEGFTSYVENRIMEQVYGTDRAVMEQALSVQGLKGELTELAANDSILHIDLQGRDPDEAFSGVPYVKGQLFLMFLEQKFGRERFDPFVKNYFDHFAFQSITTDAFISYLKQNLLQKYPGVVSDAEIQEWIFSPGLPASTPNPVSDAFDKVAAHRDSWLASKASLADLPTDGWTLHEWLYFINNLPLDIAPEQMAQLDTAFDFTHSTNAEVAHAWYLLALKTGYQEIAAPLEQYLINIGRRKLIIPLYKQLATTPEGLAFARAVFAKARPGYHPLAQGSVDELLK